MWVLKNNSDMKNLVSIEFGRDDLLRASIGVIYCWFGALKFFPELGPAEELAKTTLSVLTGNLLGEAVGYLLLAILESTIGIFLIFNLCPRVTISVALMHLMGTFMPLLLMQDVAFGETPLSLTLTGQYVMKNIIIVCALVAVYPSPTPGSIRYKLKVSELPVGKRSFQRLMKIRHAVAIFITSIHT